MKRFLSLFTVLIFSGMLAFAQTRTISGTVRDAQGNPVPFASVTETGTNNTVTSDANGTFLIKVGPAATTLTFSGIGYETATVSAAGEVVTASLNRNTQELAAVVVTSLGQVRQKASLGYATASVKSKELVQATPVNLQNGLTGKVSGLNVATTNNSVFGDTRITLRGIRSLTGNNQPMLIVDGVPLALGYLSSINPNDIADVSILKSASATAIYGPEGVNGAIVVTTKRGSKAKPVITVSHATQLETIAYMPDFQTRYGSGYNQMSNGDGEFDPNEQQSWGPEYNGQLTQFGDTGPNGEMLMLPYSYKQGGRKSFFNTGVTNQTDVSIAAGDFYLSAQNVSIQGVVPDDENRRRSVALRTEKEYNRFKAILNVRYTNGKYDVTTNNTNIYYTVTGAPGQYNLADFADWRNNFFANPDGYFTTFMGNRDYTPYVAKDLRRQKGKSDDLFGNVELNLKATNWLDFVYRVGLSTTNVNSVSTTEAFKRSSFLAPGPASGRTYPSDYDISAQVNNGNAFGSRLSSELFANFKADYKDFGMNATLGHSYRETRSRTLAAGSNNLGFSQFLSIQTRLGEATTNVRSSTAKLERFFGRVAFDYKDMVFIEGTGNYEKDSRLAPADGNFKLDDISYFYPGVNASILLHKMIPGIGDNSILNYAKLRGALSKTANVNLNPYENEITFSVATFFPYGSILGYNQDLAGYPRTINPEFVKTKEVGLELGFLKNRINFEATYYHQDNTDQILGARVSNTTGLTQTFLNAASFTNQGLELDLRLTPLVKLGAMEVDFKVNYSRMKNEVSKVLDGVDELGIGNFNYVIKGQPAFVFKVPDYIRDSATGKVIVDRVTGMPTLNPNLTTFGQTTPTDILGLNLNINWKGFSFGATAEYRTGNMILFDQVGQFLDDNGISSYTAANGRRAFVFPNSVVDDGTGKLVENTNVYTSNFGRLYWNTSINGDVLSNYLASGAFWKLREVSITYTMPARLFKGNTLKGVTFGVTGRNLMTWRPKSNPWTDPEFSGQISATTSTQGSAYTGNAQGRSTGYNLPPTRLFGANVIFTF